MQLKTVKNIMDSIHGSIGLTEFESTIIDSPLFQRLRNIKQLGTTNLVFPGAVHTRFVHSIGVMHLSTQYFDKILKSFIRSAEYYKLLQLVRLSSLLHDIGHGPFSHAFENTFDELRVSDILDKEIKFDFKHIYENKSEKLLNDKLRHEHLSYSLIYKIFDSYGCNDLIQPRNICSILDCNFKPSPELKDLVAKIIEQNGYSTSPEAEESFLRCIRSVISGEFDADRMDYLQRDALHSGVKLVGIDVDHIFESLTIKQDGKDFYIEINRNCIASLEQMLISRKFMFDQVYNHKVSVVFDWALEKIFLILKREQEIKFILNYHGFVVQSDGFILSKIKEYIQRNQGTNVEQTVFKAFLTRTKPFNLKYEIIGSSEDHKEKNFRKKNSGREIIKLELKKITNLDINRPGNLYRVQNSNYPDGQNLESCLEITKEGFYKKNRYLLISFDPLTSSEFVAKIKEKEKIFFPSADSGKKKSPVNKVAS